MVYMAGVKRAVDTGDTYFAEIASSNITGRTDAINRLKARAVLATKKISNSPFLPARINYARYIVDCPNCGGAEFAFEDNLFLCSFCGNSDINGEIRTVVLPSKRARIEAILSYRAIKNRHWTTETIKTLEAENIAAGLGVS